MKALPASVLGMTIGASALFAADPVLLTNFDDPPSAMVGMAVKPELVDFNGTQGGKFQNDGFRPVIRVKIPRGEAVKILEGTPVLAGDVRASASENPVKFVKLSLVVQTDVSGSGLFESVESAGCNPLKEPGFAFNLAEANTKSIPSIKDIAKQYDDGKGSMLVFAIIQHSPKGETSTVTYDNLRLEPK